MSKDREELFQQSNSCCICEKLIGNDNKKIRDHCHVTEKFRGSDHWNCNINFQLMKKVPVIFHNLRGDDSHLIFSELNKSDVKINVIPNGLEKYMVIIKYLIEEFNPKNLELLKQKVAYPYEYMNSFEKFNEEELPARKCFHSCTKEEKIDNDSKISNGHVSVKDYLMCEKICDKFDMKNMGDCHDHYLKKI